MPQVVVKIMGAADGRPTPHDNRWLVAWNPHTEFGTLGLVSSRDRREAHRFPDTLEVMHQWKTTSHIQPVRPDGEPNRPLTAVSVAIEPE